MGHAKFTRTTEVEMKEFSVEDIKNHLNAAMLKHLKEINMTPFSVFEVSGRAMLYISMLYKHYNWDDKGMQMIFDMAKSVSVPGIVVKEDENAKGN